MWPVFLWPTPGDLPSMSLHPEWSAPNVDTTWGTGWPTKDVHRCLLCLGDISQVLPGCQVLPGASLETVLNFLQWLGHRSGTPDRPRPHSQPSELGELRWSGYLQVTKKNMCHGQNIQNMVYFPMLGDGQSIHRIQYTYCKEFLMIGRWPELIYHAFDAGISKTSVKGISATLFFRQTTDYLLRHLSRGIFDEGTCPKTHHPLILGDGMTQELY